MERLARTETNLAGMQRWGYVEVGPDPDDTRRNPPRSDLLVRSTSRGKKAQRVWLPLVGSIERRWVRRFGSDAVDRLRASLEAPVARLDAELADCLPILGYGLLTRGPQRDRSTPAGSRASGLPLPALLARALISFAVEVESESGLSLAINANVLRVLDERGVRLRDLPRMSGVSKEAIAMAMGILEKRRLAVAETDPAVPRGKVIRLTPQGRTTRKLNQDLVAAVEDRWLTRFGQGTIIDLRAALEPLVGEATAEQSRLFLGLEPSPDGWRASVPRPGPLPHFPMVLHRGGYPDGS
jgi:DNA-binding MarR family transcriptional regulator